MPDIVFFPNDLTLGSKVRVGRVGRHWRQTDLAAYATVTQSEVSAIERGLNIYPSAERRILSVLGIIPDGIEYYSKLITAYAHVPRLQAYFEKRRRYLSNGQDEAVLGN